MVDLNCRRLAVSLVVHRWGEKELYPTVETLGKSLMSALDQGLLDKAALFVVYNGDHPLNSDACVRELEEYFPLPIEVLTAQANGGYGKANNRLLESIVSQSFDTTLVMNPDVLIEEQALPRMLKRLSGDPSCGLVVPRLLDPKTGRDAHGCKRYPSVAVLATRQFLFLQRLPGFLRLNDLYEYRDWHPEWVHRGVELCSGSFMLARMRFWQDLGGFDPRYFMYFEDFDLSVRASARGWVHLYEPGAVVRHSGGGAARKPLRHRWWFVRSAFRFFMRHGWRFWQVGKKLQ